MSEMQRWVKVNNFETLMRLGVYPKEQINAQRVIIDVTLEVNINIHHDKIKNVLSYEEIIIIINKISKKNHKFLAETVDCTAPFFGLLSAHCSSSSTALIKASETRTP